MKARQLVFWIWELSVGAQGRISCTYLQCIPPFSAPDCSYPPCTYHLQVWTLSGPLLAWLALLQLWTLFSLFFAPRNLLKSLTHWYHPLPSSSLLWFLTLFYSFTFFSAGSWQKREVKIYALEVQTKAKATFKKWLFCFLNPDWEWKLLVSPQIPNPVWPHFGMCCLWLQPCHEHSCGSLLSTPFPQPLPSRPCHQENPQLRDWRPGFWPPPCHCLPLSEPRASPSTSQGALTVTWEGLGLLWAVLWQDWVGAWRTAWPPLLRQWEQVGQSWAPSTQEGALRLSWGFCNSRLLLLRPLPPTLSAIMAEPPSFCRQQREARREGWRASSIFLLSLSLFL